MALWWAKQKNVAQCLYLDDGQVMCKETHIPWLGIPSEADLPSAIEPRFAYATQEGGPIFNIPLADPELFEKLSAALEKIDHGHD